MQRTVLLVLMCYICFQDVWSVRIMELRTPAHAAEGHEALLGCQFLMEGDQLYSVKWYKDGREFYRYAPQYEPPASSFETAGVIVDMSRSSSEAVMLVNLTQHSAGVYRCEVTGETPLFTTTYEEKYMGVHLLPTTGPVISGLQDDYQVGDRVVVNCTSSASRPETHLKWWLNDQLVPQGYLRGPWYKVSAERPDATETILQLRFTVTTRHFKDGAMKLKCQAIIAPMYEDEAVHRTPEDMPKTTPSSNFDKDYGLVVRFDLSPKTETSHYSDVIEDATSRSQVSLVLIVIMLFVDL